MPATLIPLEDPWLAPDKAQHFVFCFACTAVSYLLARRSSSLRRHRLVIGAAVGVGEAAQSCRRQAPATACHQRTSARALSPFPLPLANLSIHVVFDLLQRPG